MKMRPRPSFCGFSLSPTPTIIFSTLPRFTPARLLSGILHSVHAAVVTSVGSVAVAVLPVLSWMVTYRALGLLPG